MTGSQQFYVTSGTLRSNAASYVERKADRDLIDGLLAGEFCFVLDARQMGKSSLMVRTAVRLREAGSTVAVVDLTQIGQNLSPQQWYDGLLSQLGRQVDLEDEIEDFAAQPHRLGPMQSFFEALSTIVLKRISGPIVIFVDEIDAVRSLRFSTDEFFAGIRECYNRRSLDSDFARLSFCLIGVAMPADLISDVRTTPFNIGRRIELFDFTNEEAQPLRLGFSGNDAQKSAQLDRVLSWTSGHPYLTQVLCSVVASCESPADNRAVDELCTHQFLADHVRESDDNLALIRNRLLKDPTVDPRDVLELYRKVSRGRSPVKADDRDPVVACLRLSGIVSVTGGVLQVRNRIYARVFSEQWIDDNLPEAHLRQVRAAYRRGLMRAASIGFVIVVSMALLSLVAWNFGRMANRDRLLAVTARDGLRKNLYSARIAQASLAVSEGNTARARELLASLLDPGTDAFRGFEWNYLSNLVKDRSIETLIDGKHPTAHRLAVTGLCFDKELPLLISASLDGSLAFWNTGNPAQADSNHGSFLLAKRISIHGSAMCLAESPDGQWLAVGTEGGFVMVWQRKQWLQALRERQTDLPPYWRIPAKTVYCIRFSPDSKRLIDCEQTGSPCIHIWSPAEKRLIADVPASSAKGTTLLEDGTVAAYAPEASGLALYRPGDRYKPRPVVATHGELWVAPSPDGKLIGYGDVHGTFGLVDPKSGRVIEHQRLDKSGIVDIAFSPDGKTAVTTSQDSRAVVWSIPGLTRLADLVGHGAPVMSVAVKSDSQFIATGDDAGSIKIWRMPKAPEKDQVPSGGTVMGVAVSPDGTLFASNAGSGHVRIYRAADLGQVAEFLVKKGGWNSVRFTSDGKRLLIGGGAGMLYLADIAAHKILKSVHGHTASVRLVVLSPDGSTVVTVGREGAMKFWTADLNEVGTLDNPLAPITGVSFSPDGRSLIAVGKNMMTMVVDVSTRRVVRTMGSDKFAFVCCAVSPDGNRFATGAEDGTVAIWDIRDQRLIDSYQAHSANVFDICYVESGRTLASAGRDARIKLWNTGTRQEVLTLDGPDDGVLAVAGSPKGDYLVSGGLDNITRIWRADLSENR